MRPPRAAAAIVAAITISVPSSCPLTRRGYPCCEIRKRCARSRRERLRADLAEQRLRVERVESQSGSNLLTRRLRPLVEQPPQQVAGLRIPPPVFADFADEVVAQLRR